MYLSVTFSSVETYIASFVGECYFIPLSISFGTHYLRAFSAHARQIHAFSR